MGKQLLLLIRISTPAYNKTLYDEYKIYMNHQMAFTSEKLTSGQHDGYEGAISTVPFKLRYSIDDKVTWKELSSEVKMMRKDNKAYIYCMYGVTFAEEQYDKENNKFYHLIPWEYIEPLWQGDSNTEMMVIKNTSVFKNKFHEAAERDGLSHAYGQIQYDLEEKLTDIEYMNIAMRDSFEAVYHKPKMGYEMQNEVRMSVLCPNKPDKYELQLTNDGALQFTLIPLVYGKPVLIELQGLEFENDMPVRFSNDIKYYEPTDGSITPDLILR